MKSITFETESTTSKLSLSDTEGIMIDGVAIGGGSGENTTYNSTSTSSSATTVQEALDEALSRLDTLESKGSWTFTNVAVNTIATKNQFLRLSTGLTVTLPATPNDGARVGVIDVNGLGDSETFIISGNGATIYGETDITMNIKYFSEIYQYIADGNKWVIESTPVTNN